MINAGAGITIPNPIKSPEDLKQRLPTQIDIKKKLSHVFRAIHLIKEKLQGKVPLIGFSAAPWTLMYYMVGGTSKVNQDVGMNWLQNHPAESMLFLDQLTTVVIEYLSEQVSSGVDLLQIFEAMGDYISEDMFMKYALPCLKRIAIELKQRHPTIPLLVFPRGACYAVDALQQCGYDVISIDMSVDRSSIRQLLTASHRMSPSPLGRVSTLQGAFDVNLLRSNNPNTSPAIVRANTKIMLRQLGTQKLIANLGEGLSGLEDPALVAAFIDAVHEVSEELIKDEKLQRLTARMHVRSYHLTMSYK